MKNFLKSLALVSITISANNLLADDSLGIGTKFIPSKISYKNPNDIVSKIIVTNVTTSFSEGKDKTSPISIRRKESEVEQAWIFEYKKDLPLNDQEDFSGNTIKDSIDFIRGASWPNQEVIEKIKKIDDFTNENSLTLVFTLKEKDNFFPANLSKFPLVDVKLASIFKDKIGEGTNFPFYGSFQVIEYKPEDSITLRRNNNFGFISNNSGFLEVRIKLFKEEDSRMRAIRTGSIYIIICADIQEIADASEDSTLSVLDSPIKLENCEKIITRKSLALDENFTTSFKLEGIKRGE